MITGQGNGQGGREHGQKCDQLPGQRSLTDPAAREHVAGVWGISPDEMPRPGLHRGRDHERHPPRRDQGAALDLLQPAGLAARCQLHARGAGEAGVLRRDRFLPFGDRAARRRRAGRQPAGGGGRRHCQRGGARHPHSEGRRSARQRAHAIPRSSATWPAAWAAASISRSREPREIFEELREASRGGIADYYGITYEKIDQQMGVFWPCPTLDHPGTPRLFEDGRFFHPDGKARFMSLAWRESGDPVDAEFPIYLTTGRVVSQYLSGTQTRRIGALVDQYPEPKLEIHPRLAEQHGISTGDWVTVTSRRSAITLAGDGGAHHPARHRLHSLPLARRPQRQPADAPHARPAQQDSGVQGVGLPHREGRRAGRPRRDVRHRVLRRPVALHRLPVLPEGLRGVRHASRRFDDQLRFRRPPGVHRHRGLRLLALRRSDLRAGLPGRRDQEVRGRHRRLVAEAALHRLLELRAGLPVRNSQAGAGIRADDEVRHVLRPHVGRQDARCAPRSAPARR